MRYGQIRKLDIANGPGVRTSVFVTGCSLNCKGCFNKEYQNKLAGKEWTKKQEDLVVSFLKLNYVNGLSILGGEPLEQDEFLLNLLKRVKKEVKKTIWLWSGYCFENLNQAQKNLLNFVDVLVDGPFILSKKNLNLKFRGSSNQRIINLNKTKSSGKICLWNELKKEE